MSDVQKDSKRPKSSTLKNQDASKKEKKTDSKLPDGWEERYSEKKQKIFYKHVKTGETSWSLPEATAESTKSDTSNKDKRSSDVENVSEIVVSKDREKNAIDSKSIKTTDEYTAKKSSKSSLLAENKEQYTHSEKSTDDKESKRRKDKHSVGEKEKSKVKSDKPSEKSKDNEEKKTEKDKSESAKLVSSDWVEKYSEKKGKPYWKNSKTGESTWTNPFPVVSEAMTNKGNSNEKSHKTGNNAKAEKHDVKRKNIHQDNDSVDDSREGSDVESGSGVDSDGSEQSVDPIWEEKFSVKKNKPYWKNTTTGESTWEKPAPAKKLHSQGISKPSKTSSAKKDTRTDDHSDDDGASLSTPESTEKELPEGWEVRHSKTKGRHYYVNKKLQISQWHFPTDSSKAGASNASKKSASFVNAIGAFEGKNVEKPSIAASDAKGSMEKIIKATDKLDINNDEIRANINSSKSFWTQQGDKDKEAPKPAKMTVPVIDKEALNQRKSVLMGLAGGLDGGVPLGGAMPPGYLNKRKSALLANPILDAEAIEAASNMASMRPFSDKSLPSLDSEMMESILQAYDADGSGRWTGDPSDSTSEKAVSQPQATTISLPLAASTPLPTAPMAPAAPAAPAARPPPAAPAARPPPVAPAARPPPAAPAARPPPAAPAAPAARPPPAAPPR